MTGIYSLLFILILHCPTTESKDWIPCSELNHSLRVHCICNVAAFHPSRELGFIEMNCDGTIFHDEIPHLPYDFPIVSFSQRFSGPQVLPVQVFGSLKFPIKMLDFSSNSIRRLPDKAFNGAQDTLIKLHIQDNLLGDTLNPIFSSSVLHSLHKLEILDLSRNQIKSIEEGLLKGCSNLLELYLEENYLSSVPKNSINGPANLKILSLKGNHISKLEYESFSSQPQLKIINLINNKINLLQYGSFRGLRNISSIYLGGNKIVTLNSDAFEGVPTLEKLDLSTNFITQFPTVALQNNGLLKNLNLSANMIKKIDFDHFQPLKKLEVLDLSRNGLTTISSGTFRSLKYLKYLDLSVNSLRTIEDDALEGLLNLQKFIIRDNNILLVPGSALGRLPSLSNLQLDFNRIAALSSDILGSIQSAEIKVLSLSRNVIRELPSSSFEKFKNLEYLDLSGNSLATISSDLFLGLETSLRELRLSQNKITSFGSMPLNLTNLIQLDVSDNNIADISYNTFSVMRDLAFLNISGNHRITSLPSALLKPLKYLQFVDLSKCNIKQISIDFFVNMTNLKIILFKNNHIQELSEGSFANLWNITNIDLSFNKITDIKPSSFINVMSIKRLSLKGNALTKFRGEIFNTGTGLEELDISDNMLNYLFPNSFHIHPRLKYLKVSNNKLDIFPVDLTASLQYLEYIDLSKNQMKTIEALTFARLPNLRLLNLASNELESLSAMAFHNSTQLQFIDLSYNKLEKISERTFEGLVRLALLNLKNNQLSELAELLFDRSKIQYVESINLAQNNFSYVPLKSFQKQLNYLSSIDLSYNKIRDIPANDNIMINIKKVDLSFNPLSDISVTNILSEPKTVRELNLAGTGIKSIKSLETPFLQILNLSNNHLENINEIAFQRTTLLETLDLSNNLLSDLDSLSKSWEKLSNLRLLNLSNNLFEKIGYGNFENLELLSSLSLAHLDKCSQLDTKAFKHLPNLLKLKLHDLPLLGYIDIQNILDLLPGINSIDIEVKDYSFGADQIQLTKHPRVNTICLRGERLKTISSGTLAGLKSTFLTIKLINTGLMTLPPGLLFPVPRSAHLNLDISGSKVTVLSPQFLSALEDRRSNFILFGLNTNPILCDCNARALRRWLPNSQMTNVTCKAPETLKGKLLTEIGDDELTCDKHYTKLSTNNQINRHVMHNSTSNILTEFTTKESIIIWSMETTPLVPKLKKNNKQIKQTAMSNDDTVIIGVVGGVVAFIAILIIIICIIRLKISSPRYYNNEMVGMSPMSMGLGAVQIKYNNKGQPTPALYTLPPYSPQNYATFPHKNLKNSAQNLSQPRTTYSTISRIPYYSPQQQKQYANSSGQYVIYPDEKGY